MVCAPSILTLLIQVAPLIPFNVVLIVLIIPIIYKIFKMYTNKKVELIARLNISKYPFGTYKLNNKIK
jgi:hypothetical protein